MQIKNPNTAPMNPRTSRKAVDIAAGQQYVIVEGAPKHYIPGFGLCGPGHIVTLAAGVQPGKYLQPIADSDAAKVAHDPEKADTLAAKAKERADAEAADEAAKAAAKKDADERDAALRKQAAESKK